MPCCPVLLSVYRIVIVSLNEMNGDGDGDGEMCVCVCVCVRVCVRVYMASITATARPRRTAGRATPSRKAARRSLTVEHIASRCQLSGHSRGTSAVTALDATRN